MEEEEEAEEEEEKEEWSIVEDEEVDFPLIASGASYLVCSMPALSIYIYIYIYNRTCVIP